ncbi:hypothetical protein PILCRDRAFT_6994 [Piloderma croceum F 1598]|uniref:Uncharacterized protein n=1 Tax=Piloderma croceum (strain F 1598) TaxID=765440 RepID=A0A0C3FZ30_PILCF|nr:hypothetical protein PILCRDRAFT_6994 [Piloderma croceum F 1598]
MDYNNNDDIVHIPILRELLLRLVSRHPNIPSIEPFSTDADWAYVGRAITEVAREVMAPNWPYYRSQSTSFSTGSSPTLRPSSSRASSLAPDDCGFNDDLDRQAYDDQDIPVNLDDLFLDETTSGASPQPAMIEADIPPTKRGSEHPDAPALHDEVAKRVLRLRGGVWLPKCQR